MADRDILIPDPLESSQKLAKALSETETSEADIFMASVLLKFRGSKQAQSFVKEIQNRIEAECQK